MRPRPGARRLGLPVPDLQPSLAIAEDLLDGLAGEGALRVSGTTASNRRYTGDDIAAQLFLAPASAQREGTDILDNGAGNSRSALNRRRGA